MKNNQDLWTDTGSSMLNSGLSMVFKFPIFLLVIPWVAYFAMDWIATLILADSIPSYFVPFAHALGGVLTLVYLFFYAFNWIFLKKKYVTGSFLALIGLVSITAIKYGLLILVYKDYPIDLATLVYESLRLSQFTAFAYFVWIFYRFFITTQEKLIANVQIAELEVANSVMHLNPHFILNMLNGVLSKTLKDSKTTYIEILNLLEVLQYGYRFGASVVLLKEELIVLDKFINSQNAKGNINFHYQKRIQITEEHFNLLKIPKLLLITIAQNIYKHGDLRNPDKPAILSIFCNDNFKTNQAMLSVVISNYMTVKKNGSGLGQHALIRILDYYFRGKYTTFETISHTEYSLFISIDYEKCFKIRLD